MESNQESEKSSRYGSGSGNQNDGSNGSGSGYDSEQGSNCSAENPHRVSGTKIVLKFAIRHYYSWILLLLNLFYMSKAGGTTCHRPK